MAAETLEDQKPQCQAPNEMLTNMKIKQQNPKQTNNKGQEGEEKNQEEADHEEEEEEEEGEKTKSGKGNDKVEKKESDPTTPATAGESRPTREWKFVEWYTVSLPHKFRRSPATKTFTIDKVFHDFLLSFSTLTN